MRQNAVLCGNGLNSTKQQNFSLIQIESFAHDKPILCSWNDDLLWEKEKMLLQHLEKVEKACYQHWEKGKTKYWLSALGKRRKNSCWLPVFSPIPTFFKTLLLQYCCNSGLCGKVLSFLKNCSKMIK